MAQHGRAVRVHAGSGCVAGDPNLNLFTATLAQNAALNGQIKLPEAIAAGRAAQCWIREIDVVSVDGNIWEWWFFGNSLFASGDAKERWESAYLMTAGTQIGGAGNFHAHTSPGDNGLMYIFHEDEDALTTTPPPAGSSDPAWRAANGQTGAYLNATLINRSAGAKTASGYFDVSFVLEPSEGW